MPLIKRKNSKNWIIQFQYKGKTHIKSSGTTNKKVAEQIESKMKLILVQQHELGFKEKITVAEAVDMYLKPRMKQTNYQNVRIYGNKIVLHLGKDNFISDLTTKMVTRFHHELLELSDGVQKNVLGMLKGVIINAEKNGFLIPTLEIPAVKKAKNRLRVLTSKEEIDLLEALNPIHRTGSGSNQPYLQGNYDLILLLLDTGARFSEILSLQWKSVDLKKKEIYLWRQKVGNESTLHMTSRVFETLSNRFKMKSTAWIFPNSAGTGPRSFSSPAIRKAMNSVGLYDVCIHTLRHTYASKLARSGIGIQSIASLLGHTKITTTMIYAHLLPNQVSQEAVLVLEALNEQSTNEITMVSHQ